MATVAHDPWWRLNNRFGPLKIIIVLEVLWIIFFAALVIALQTTGSSSKAELLRDGLIKIAFHAGSPYAVLNAIEHHHLTLAPVFWILFAIFTDLYSTMDVWVYVDHYVAPDLSGYLGALKAVVLMALVLSSLSFVFYIIALPYQAREKRKKREYDAKRRDLRDGDVTLLLNHVPTRN